jgi:hypothetical protein
MSEPEPVEPIVHFAVNEREVAAHGIHADMISLTTFGSHQTRVGEEGDLIDQQLNFRGGAVMGVDAAGLPIVEHQG